MPITLILPALPFCSSYISLVEEFTTNKESLIPFCLAYDYSDLQALMQRFEDDRCGKNISEKFVPHTTFWAIENGSDVVGVSNLRLELNPSLRRVGGNIGYGVRPSARRRGLGSKLLQLTLIEAGKLGLTRALITCGKDNTASSRVILNNSGIFDSEEFISERNETIERYWIDIVAEKY